MPPSPTTYLEVAVAAPIHQTLTYAPPPDTPPLSPGQRLLVPLGNRQVTGYLLGFVDSLPDGMTAKPARAVLDPAPLFPATMIPFFRWISRYYHHPLGEVIKTALPGGLTQQSKRQLVLSAEGRTPLAAYRAEHGGPEWLNDLLASGSLTPAATAKALTGGDKKNLGLWQREGWLTLDTILSEDRSRAKSEMVVSLLPAAGNPAATLKPSEQKTLDLLNSLAGEEQRPVPRRELTREYAGAGAALKGLAEKGLVALTERRVFRDPFGEPPPFFPPPAQLTEEQQTALAAIQPEIEAHRFAPFLLHGVTGSGKTEVYLRVIDRVLDSGAQVLVLVPEIGLTPQLVARLTARLGPVVGMLHSGCAAGERARIWSAAAAGRMAVVVGTRSAVFTPMRHLALIIVDEEHDPSFKQQEGFRYHARDLAVWRAKHLGVPVVLGSATPSLESYRHARQDHYHLLTLPNRGPRRALPTVRLVDLGHESSQSGLSTPLLEGLRARLARGEQTLLFLNRRGYAPVLLCPECRWHAPCDRCDARLTVHLGRQRLRCHHCGREQPVPTACPRCGHPKLLRVGEGTERIEEALRRVLPDARIARVDRDTTASRRAFEALLRKVHGHEVDVLIGTQMLAKGHDFPHVTLVGVIHADQGLHGSDFRADEQLFSQIVQVAGRAGRDEKPGLVLIQTHHPTHPLWAPLTRLDYQAFAEMALRDRRATLFPPYAHCALMRAEARAPNLATRFLETARQLAADPSDVTLGCVLPAVLARRAGYYRAQLLVTSQRRGALQAWLKVWLARIPEIPDAPRVRWSVDVDPYSLF